MPRPIMQAVRQKIIDLPLMLIEQCSLQCTIKTMSQQAGMLLNIINHYFSEKQSLIEVSLKYPIIRLKQLLLTTRALNNNILPLSVYS